MVDVCAKITQCLNPAPFVVKEPVLPDGDGNWARPQEDIVIVGGGGMAGGATASAPQFVVKEPVLPDGDGNWARPQEDIVIVGGATASTITPKVIEVCTLVNGAARRRYLGLPDDVQVKSSPFPAYEPWEVLTQVVAGTNYFVKIRISAPAINPQDGIASMPPPPEFIQLRIFEGLDGSVELAGMLKGPEADGPVRYF